MPIVVGLLGMISKGLVKSLEENGNMRKNQDHPDRITLKIN